MNEMVAHSYNIIYGMQAIGLRIFNLYRPGENVKGNYASIVSKFLDAKERGESLMLYGDGTQARDLTYVKDATDMILKILENGNEPLYDIGTGAVQWSTMMSLI